jgi:L-lactate dehydrogenase complex protein LldG
MSARDEILGRIREAVAGAPVPATPEAAYRRSLGKVDLVALFAERIVDYDVTVHVTDDVAATVADACTAHAVRRLAVPLELPEDWRPQGIELVPDDGLSARELDAVDGALTGCALAIAETGTIVLDCGPTQGRRALTLIPDLHVCVVYADTIVGTVPEAFDRVSVERAVTFVSGPSATSDIELSRVRGVHGPRRLDVIVVQR